MTIEIEEIAASVAAAPVESLVRGRAPGLRLRRGRRASIRSYLDSVGMLDENREGRPAVRTLARFATLADRCLMETGLMAHWTDA